MLRRTLLTASIAAFSTCVLSQAQVPLPAPAPAAAPIPGLSDDGVVLQIPAGPDTVKDVLDTYQRLTGKRLILDAQVTGPVPLNINTKVSKEEAIKIIEVALLMNQFTLVPTEDKNIWKVLGIGKNPKSSGVPIYTDEAALPLSEQVVSFLFKLQYADAMELQQTLSQAFPPSPVLGGQSITALPKAGALLVTENTAIIRQIIRIIYELDREPAKVDSRFFILQRADAKDIQEKLTDILTRKDSAAPAGGVVPPAPGAPAGQPGRPAVIRTQTTPEGLPLPAGAPVADAATTIELNVGPNEENIIAGRIKITADVRTNRIHIVTRPENMKFISDLIEEFDANIPFGEPSVYPLKYVDATTVFESVVKAISDPGQDGQAGTGTGQTGTLGNRPQGAATTGSNLFGNRGGQGATGFGNTTTGGGTGIGGATLSESLNAEPKDLTPNAVTIGNTRIISDPRANSIIVVGNKDVKEKLFAVIAQLDVRAPQVVIHTCIGQLTLSETEQFGVNYIMNLGRNLDNFASGATTGTGTGTTTGGPGVSFVGNNPILNFANLLNQEQIKQIAVAGATGFNGYFTAGNAFDVLITALESTNKFRVVSRPILHTSNNKKAIISSGEEIAIPTSIQSGFTGGNNDLVTNSSIQFKTVALQLEVIPFINSDREVSMDIVQKIDEQAGTTTIDNNQIPRIATRVLQTNVTVPSEATLILGGLIKARNDKTYSGIPLLSRIPLLGPLFRTTTYNKTREELVILIRPSVTFTPKESVRVTETEQEALRLEPDLEQTLFDANHRERGIEVRRPLPLLRDEPVIIEREVKEVKPVKSSKVKTSTTKVNATAAAPSKKANSRKTEAAATPGKTNATAATTTTNPDVTKTTAK